VTRPFDVAVLGAGPAGLLAALQFARSGRRVVIVSNRLPAPDDAQRVDAVPASFVALLVELGINPTAVGVNRLYRARLAAWSSAEPIATEGASCAHLERPALDIALLAAAKGAGCTIRSRFRRDGEAVGGRDWTADHFVDATGRAAVSAARHVRAPKPWIARTFWTSQCADKREFAIAQLPNGYAYRLGSAATLAFGVVGRRDAVVGSALDIAQHLRLHARWILEDLPPLAEWRTGRACPASVQWSEGGGLRIGDAALARDALSSQGLAAGAAEAMQACAMRGARDRALIVSRQREQRNAHLRALLSVLESGRFSQAPVWRGYIDFVRSQLDPETFGWTAAVQGGRIRRVDLSASAVIDRS
jgi:2-polyprenyl-6-methoxyphenol hydroxylase-like FAD-dependent oxidoreductase